MDRMTTSEESLSSCEFKPVDISKRKRIMRYFFKQSSDTDSCKTTTCDDVSVIDKWLRCVLGPYVEEPVKKPPEDRHSPKSGKIQWKTGVSNSCRSQPSKSKMRKQLSKRRIRKSARLDEKQTKSLSDQNCWAMPVSSLASNNNLNYVAHKFLTVPDLVNSLELDDRVEQTDPPRVSNSNNSMRRSCSSQTAIEDVASNSFKSARSTDSNCSRQSSACVSNNSVANDINGSETQSGVDCDNAVSCQPNFGADTISDEAPMIFSKGETINYRIIQVGLDSCSDGETVNENDSRDNKADNFTPSLDGDQEFFLDFPKVQASSYNVVETAKITDDFRASGIEVNSDANNRNDCGFDIARSDDKNVVRCLTVSSFLNSIPRSQVSVRDGSDSRKLSIITSDEFDSVPDAAKETETDGGLVSNETKASSCCFDSNDATNFNVPQKNRIDPQGSLEKFLNKLADNNCNTVKDELRKDSFKKFYLIDMQRNSSNKVNSRRPLRNWKFENSRKTSVETDGSERTNLKMGNAKSHQDGFEQRKLVASWRPPEKRPLKYQPDRKVNQGTFKVWNDISRAVNHFESKRRWCDRIAMDGTREGRPACGESSNETNRRMGDAVAQSINMNERREESQALWETIDEENSRTVSSEEPSVVGTCPATSKHVKLRCNETGESSDKRVYKIDVTTSSEFEPTYLNRSLKKRHRKSQVRFKNNRIVSRVKNRKRSTKLKSKTSVSITIAEDRWNEEFLKRFTLDSNREKCNKTCPSKDFAAKDIDDKSNSFADNPVNTIDPNCEHRCKDNTTERLLTGSNTMNGNGVTVKTYQVAKHPRNYVLNCIICRCKTNREGFANGEINGCGMKDNLTNLPGTQAKCGCITGESDKSANESFRESKRTWRFANSNDPSWRHRFAEKYLLNCNSDISETSPTEVHAATAKDRFASCVQPRQAIDQRRRTFCVGTQTEQGTLEQAEQSANEDASFKIYNSFRCLPTNAKGPFSSLSIIGRNILLEQTFETSQSIISITSDLSLMAKKTRRKISKRLKAKEALNLNDVLVVEDSESNSDESDMRLYRDIHQFLCYSRLAGLDQGTKKTSETKKKKNQKSFERGKSSILSVISKYRHPYLSSRVKSFRSCISKETKKT